MTAITELEYTISFMQAGKVKDIRHLQSATGRWEALFPRQQGRAGHPRFQGEAERAVLLTMAMSWQPTSK